jgi:hypothetical protein
MLTFSSSLSHPIHGVSDFTMCPCFTIGTNASRTTSDGLQPPRMSQNEPMLFVNWLSQVSVNGSYWHRCWPGYSWRRICRPPPQLGWITGLGSPWWSAHESKVHHFQPDLNSQAVPMCWDLIGMRVMSQGGRAWVPKPEEDSQECFLIYTGLPHELEINIYWAEAPKCWGLFLLTHILFNTSLN